VPVRNKSIAEFITSLRATVFGYIVRGHGG
jgi:hypothetical protein